VGAVRSRCRRVLGPTGPSASGPVAGPGSRPPGPTPPSARRSASPPGDPPDVPEPGHRATKARFWAIALAQTTSRDLVERCWESSRRLTSTMYTPMRIRPPLLRSLSRSHSCSWSGSSLSPMSPPGPPRASNPTVTGRTRQGIAAARNLQARAVLHRERPDRGDATGVRRSAGAPVRRGDTGAKIRKWAR
jgi:hypothetical protein